MSIAPREMASPRRPLLLLAAAILFTIPPMFNALPAWVPIGLLVVLASKFWMERKGLWLRSPLVKAFICALVLAAVAMTFRSLRGAEPAMAVFLLLTALKILEAHTARDFHVLVIFGWFLCLWGFLTSQTLAVAVLVFIGFTLLLAAMVLFQRRAFSSRAAARPALRAAAILLAQAVPLIGLMFILFPRGSFGVRFTGLLPAAQGIGFAERLNPGVVSELAASQEIAFRAAFPAGNIPPHSARYWRGAVLLQAEGLSWEPGGIQGNPEKLAPAGAGIRQRILLDPHGQTWMFALDRPLEAPGGANLAPGDVIRSNRRIVQARSYEVTSYRAMLPGNLSPEEIRASLQLPPSITPAVRSLVDEWKAQGAEPREIAQAALQFFRTEAFEYTLAPGEMGGTSIDEFLFERKVGFCEHYAGTFATLMRVARIPARVVVGYLGGEYNDIGGYLIVRQADAHAWCEVWLEGRWERVDVTSVVAPSRLNTSLEAYLANRGAETRGETTGGTGETGSRGKGLLRNFQLAWDSLNYAWDTRVIGFDQDVQRTFLTDLKLPTARRALLLALAAAAGVVVAAYGLWMFWRGRSHPDPVKELYDRFCRQAQKGGIVRAPWEGPEEFARRAELALPHRAALIRQLSGTYIRLRYSPQPAASLRRTFAEQVRAFGRSGAATPGNQPRAAPH